MIRFVSFYLTIIVALVNSAKNVKAKKETNGWEAIDLSSPRKADHTNQVIMYSNHNLVD